MPFGSRGSGHKAMAAQGARKKDAGSAPKGGARYGPGPMLVVLQLFCAIVAVVTLLIMLVGLFDVGGPGLGGQLRSVALVPIGLFALTAIGAIAPAFMPRATDEEAIQARIQEVEARLLAQIGEMRGKVETHVGADYQTLRARNKELQDQLDAIEAAKTADITQEVEKLRTINADLEAQIKQWAIGSVSQAVATGNGPESVKVA